MAKKSDKDRIYRKVVAAAIALDLKCGHLKWPVARLARQSGISRPLIYYYFGKSKLGILVEATKIIGGELAGFTEEKKSHWDTGRIDLALADSRRMLSDFPGLRAWYFLMHDGDHDIGRAIRKIEAEHIAKIRRYLPKANESDARAIFALFFGVSFSPIGDAATPRTAVNLVLAGLSIFSADRTGPSD